MTTVYHGHTHLLLVAISVFISLVIGELTFARFFPQRTLSYLKQTNLSCYQKSKRLPYEFRSNCSGQFLAASGEISRVRINNIGFRGADVAEKQQKRILFIGDSYVFGYGVEEEDTMSAYLARELGVEVINAGVWGAGPDFEYVIAEQLIPKLHPDFLLFGIFPENDLRDLTETIWKLNDDRSLQAVKNDKFVDKEGFLWRDAVSRRYYIPILRDSHMFSFFADRFSNFISKAQYRLTGRERPKDPKLSYLGPYEKRLDISWDYSCLYDMHCDGALADAREKATFVFNQLEELSRKTNTPLAVVIIPFKPQMTGEEPLFTLFHQLAKERDIPVIDLASSLHTSQLSLQEIYQVDDHFSKIGNSIAAMAIAQWFVANR